jgi:hypothetical protein
MAIKKDTLDQLLEGRDPQAVFSKDGLLDELKKALGERVLNAELEDHLQGEGRCHVWTPLADQGLFLALRGSWVRSCLRPSFAENRIRWP